MNKKLNNLKIQIENYSAYAEQNNCHRKPVAGNNCGCDGRLYEQLVKVALGNYKFKGVAKSGHADTKKLGNSFEIKQGCGELGVIDENGNIVSTVFTKDYIIYAPDYMVGDNVKYVSWVMTTAQFLSALNECGLIRKKVSSFMSRRKAQGLDWYPDRIAIQSYKNSHRKYNLWTETLENYGQPLCDWLEENCIKSIEL